MRDGERQVAPDLSGIRRDHIARYEWTARLLPPGSRVVDFACGVGYGAFILAEAGHHVLAIDADGEALAYAREHYAHPRISFRQCTADGLGTDIGAHDVAVCFETIEHIRDPLPALRALNAAAPRLIASVPNEDKFPHRGRVAFHHRHYRPFELQALLESAGYIVTGWSGQEGPQSEVEPDWMGRTIIAMAERGTPAAKTQIAPAQIAKPPAPKHVSIVGLGPSAQHYMDTVKRMGGRRAFCEETWAINSLGDVLAADRIFHMDDVRIQQIRAAALPDSNIAHMLRWMRTHPGPIYTSRTHPDYPGLVAYPLEDVLNDLGYDYFNNTAAYAIAYAIHIGVERVSFWGCDFTYPNAHDAEKGRACCEYWIGRAMQRGISVAVTNRSSLLDACEPKASRLYGYDTVDVDIAEQPDRRLKVTFTERAELPTADEIEARYDHTKHPSPLVETRQEEE